MSLICQKGSSSSSSETILRWEERIYEREKIYSIPESSRLAEDEEEEKEKKTKLFKFCKAI